MNANEPVSDGLTERVGRVADKVTAMLHMDLIGKDCCVLAVRLLIDELGRAGITARPAQAMVKASWRGVSVGLAKPTKPGVGRGAVEATWGHAVCIVADRLMVDLTIGQATNVGRTRAPDFPELEPAMLVGAVDQIGGSDTGGGFTCSTVQNGVHLEYLVDIEGPFYFEGTQDWNEALVRVHEMIHAMSTSATAKDVVRSARTKQKRAKLADALRF